MNRANCYKTYLGCVDICCLESPGYKRSSNKQEKRQDRPEVKKRKLDYTCCRVLRADFGEFGIH